MSFFRFVGTLLLVACVCFEGYQLHTHQATKDAHVKHVGTLLQKCPWLLKNVPQLTADVVRQVVVGLHFLSVLLLLNVNFLVFSLTSSAILFTNYLNFQNAKLDLTLLPLLAPAAALFGGLCVVYGSQSCGHQSKVHPSQVADKNKKNK